MEWLTQYGAWIILGAGILLLFSRGLRGAGGCGGGHGSHGGHSSGHGGNTAAGSATDPVSKKSVATDHAITSYYGGRIYYFENEENRRRFEASPGQYAADAGAEAAPPHRRHRRGC